MQTYTKSITERVDKSTEITKVFDHGNFLKRTEKSITIGSTTYLYTKDKLRKTLVFQNLGAGCTAFDAYTRNSRSHEEWCNGKAVRQHHYSTNQDYSHICERRENKYICVAQSGGVVLTREEYYDTTDGFVEDSYDYQSQEPLLNRLQYVSMTGPDAHYAVYRTYGLIESRTLTAVLDHYIRWTTASSRLFTRIDINGKLIEESSRSDIF